MLADRVVEGGGPRSQDEKGTKDRQERGKIQAKREKSLFQNSEVKKNN